MAASSGRVLRFFLGRYCGCYSLILQSGIKNVTRQNSVVPVLSRLVSTSSALQRKNIAAEGPEKYTEEFIKKQIEEFNIGKRHLANMMGEDPETFTQEDIDRSIAYLFPSSLFEKRARPVMKHPDEIFPKQRAVQWGEDGRPFHFLFYTGKQTYYSLMHDTYEKFLNIEKYQDQMRSKGLFSQDTKQITLIGSRWLSKEELEEVLVEPISELDYAHFIQLLERILTLPYCATEEEYIHRFRRELEIQSKKQKVEPLQHDDNGIAFSVGEGRRKTASAVAVVRDNGSGKILINGVDFLQYFPILQDREQLMFPLQFLDRLGRHDLEGTVTGGGRSAQAGALRLAISRAVLSFLTETEVENMRQAGLLTPDPRVKERKKPGQEGARRKFTWKKR
ncbi:small ribosomal subunit protein uS9m [Lepisosteus oculatus]|uniref:Small ribosomal subunit protein uS9m n=1 Tax=Lepisosteus oculatus TaxID=7918 RepID=W5MQG1_LEPOC|nr:PREDICTED: 28S ribosomal protein S9, mitochondrial [Lepisosteus oculatus]